MKTREFCLQLRQSGTERCTLLLGFVGSNADCRAHSLARDINVLFAKHDIPASTATVVVVDPIEPDKVLAA